MQLLRALIGRGSAGGLCGAGIVVAVVVGAASLALASVSPASTAPGDPVLAWGNNADGQLGNGTNTNSNVPVSTLLPAGTTVIAIAGGGQHSLGLTSTGQVLAWGLNIDGQLGNGTNTNSNVPVSVSLPAGTAVTAIAAGGGHSLGLTSTGQVLAWGRNNFGQLGNGTNTNSNVPVSVSLPAGTTVTAIAAGGQHSLAVTSTGRVLAWGLNLDGQLGNGTITSSNVPMLTQLPAGTTVTVVAAGANFSLALATSLPPTTVTTTVTTTTPTRTVTKTVTKTTTKTKCCHEENNENNNNNDDNNSDEDHEHEDSNNNPWRLPMAR